jgi:gluconokinase
MVQMIIDEEKTPPKLIVSGGIQRSPSSVQRLADVIGHTLYPNNEMEASIRGAAINALEKLGYTAPEMKLGKPVKPRAKFAKLYAIEREKQRALEESTRLVPF